MPATNVTIVERWITDNAVPRVPFTAADIAAGTGLEPRRVYSAISGIRQHGLLPLHVVGRGRYVIDPDRPITFARARGNNADRRTYLTAASTPANGANGATPKLFPDPVVDTLTVVGKLITGDLLIIDGHGQAYTATLHPLEVPR